MFYLRVILTVVLTRVVTVTLVRTRVVRVAIVVIILGKKKLVAYPCMYARRERILGRMWQHIAPDVFIQ